jgi:hypothetical protein
MAGRQDIPRALLLRSVKTENLTVAILHLGGYRSIAGAEAIKLRVAILRCVGLELTAAVLIMMRGRGGRPEIVIASAAKQSI